jgi:hypothetical protein
MRLRSASAPRVGAPSAPTAAARCLIGWCSA